MDIDNAIDNNIDALKLMGLIEREGGAKGGHWKINYIASGAES